MRVLFLDFSTGLDSLESLSRARRGLTNSLLLVPDALSKLNNDVWVVSDIKTPGVTAGGVRWVTMDDDETLRREWDFLVMNRGIGAGYFMVKAKRRVLWTHDLPHMGFAEDPGVFKSVAGVVFMSAYGEAVWRTMFPQIGAGFRIPNGVDKSIFYPREKDHDLLVYGFHPIRGVRRLPLIFGAAREALGRNITLKVFSSTYAKETLADDHMDKYDPHQDEDIPEGMVVSGALPVEKWAEELGRAGLAVMPTGYPEICSNSVLQAIASGTPLVTTGGIGATPEWVHHFENGWLTKFTPADYQVHQAEITRGIVSILRNRDLHNRLMDGCVKTKIYDWQEIGEKWNQMFARLF